MTVEEIPLSGGNVNVVVRVGDTVRRTMSPRSSEVHELLQHFERVGFDGAPRFLGIDDSGREILSFVPGAAIWLDPQPLNDLATLAAIGKVIRAFHDAAPAHVHGDLGPWNLVLDGDGVCRIIDWDTATTGAVTWDLSFALLTNCWLGGNTCPFRTEPFTDAELAERIRAFASGYRADEPTLCSSIELIPDRAEALVALIEERAAAREAAWVAMLEDGHARVWAEQAEFARNHVKTWCDLLFPLSA